MANILNIGLSAVATGVDTITATFSPAITLTNRRIVFLRTAGTNATTTPTFNPNGLGAQTITKNNGDALAIGDLDGDVILMYDLPNTNWELLTPKVSTNTGANDLIVGDTQKIRRSDSAFYIDFGDGTYFQFDGYGSGIYGDATFTEFYGTELRLNFPDVNLQNETASLILSTDASKNIKGLPIATYPSLTELSYVKGVTSAIQTQMNLKAPLASPTFTGTVVLPSTTSIGNVSATEIGYLDGLSSDLQVQLGTKLTSANITQTITNGVTDKAPSEDAVYDANAALQAQITSNAALLGSPLTLTDVQTHTGTVDETIIPCVCPNLVGAMTDNCLLNLAMGVQATNNGNNKDFRFYISDAQDALTNAVLIGRYTATTAAVNTVLMEKILAMTSISTQNIISAALLSTATGTTMGTTSIDFTSVSKYIVITFQLANAGDTMKMQFAYSSINKKP